MSPPHCDKVIKKYRGMYANTGPQKLAPEIRENLKKDALKLNGTKLGEKYGISKQVISIWRKKGLIAKRSLK